MKKQLLLFTFLLTCCLTAAAAADTLLIYFSCTGNTQALAATAAQAIGADLWQIVPEVPYTDADIHYSDAACRANQEQNDALCRPAYAGEPPLDGYDTLLLAYPIWWGEEPRIIDTLLEQVDLTGRHVAAMCTSGGSGIETSYSHLKAKAPGADWLGARRFSADTAPENITDWCASIGISKKEVTNMNVTIGPHTLHVRLADNESAAALRAMLTDGALTIPASNYGGFEKVCPLGTILPRHDEEITAEPGDVMLYAGSSIVLFHGSNRWAYTRLGRIEDVSDLPGILGGAETQITLSLETE